MNARWGVALTVSAPLEQVLAYAAHYLDLGAQRIWLCFDNPDDPAADVLAKERRLNVIRCSSDWWEKVAGQRPQTHQERQVKNITHITRRAALDWVGHFDVDEFLISECDIGHALAQVDAAQLVLRVEPWEALHSAELPADIFTAKHFRRQLGGPLADMAARLYGPEGDLLEKGMLSHTVGKCFFRTGQKQMVARIHAARIKGEQVPGGDFHPAMALLHFHAQDRAAWLARLPFRLSKGAYQYRPQMQAFLQDASPQQIADFYDLIQVARPELLHALQEHGLLREVQLDLARKVATRFPHAI